MPAAVAARLRTVFAAVAADDLDTAATACQNRVKTAAFRARNR
ncbi:hypothetical protein ABGB18_41935 [Nonomuraea sp. B12E4]